MKYHHSVKSLFIQNDVIKSVKEQRLAKVRKQCLQTHDGKQESSPWLTGLQSYSQQRRKFPGHFQTSMVWGTLSRGEFKWTLTVKKKSKQPFQNSMFCRCSHIHGIWPTNCFSRNLLLKSLYRQSVSFATNNTATGQPSAEALSITDPSASKTLKKFILLSGF